jgi:integration host factor subunit beta
VGGFEQTSNFVGDFALHAAAESSYRSSSAHVKRLRARTGQQGIGTMTKSDLIDELSESQKLPKGRAELLVNVIFEAMEQALRRGDRIEIRGFGSFEIRTYRAYEGRNPRTGVAVSVKPKRLPFFKVGKELKERVDAGRLDTDRAAPKRAPIPGAKPAPAPAAATEATQTDHGGSTDDAAETPSATAQSA